MGSGEGVGPEAASMNAADARDSPLDARRRSVDIGGLALALGGSSRGEGQSGMGKGWGGWEESDQSDSMYAELLSDMYTQTQTAVNRTVLTSFPTVSESTRGRLIDALDKWHFEPHKLADDEVITCTLLLFETLYRVEGMKEAVGVPLSQIGSFLLHLRQAYRETNSYHNFHHALDVFQATHHYLQTAGAVPSTTILHIPEMDSEGRWRSRIERKSSWIGLLRPLDIFALYIAAVGHDVGHPGFNNIFMKNAQAPLSQVYDHKSALEQMHCAFLLPIMKHHGLGRHLLPQSQGGQSNFKRLLLDTVLATDMGVHKDFMTRFSSLMEHPQGFSLSEARTLLCQALIKCADISNPSRPHIVSQHWSAALAAEWASQALLERQLCLPVSVQEGDDPITEAKGQISFITFCVSPLLEITSLAIPEMRMFAEQCSTNCGLWRARLSELESDANASKKEAPASELSYSPDLYSNRSFSPSQSQDYHTVFPLSLPAHFYHSPLALSSLSVADTESIAGSDTRTEVDYTDVESSTGIAKGAAYEDSIPSSSRSSSPTTLVVNGNGPSPEGVHSSFTFQFSQGKPYGKYAQGVSPLDSSPAADFTSGESENMSPRSAHRSSTSIPSLGGGPSIAGSSAASIRSVSTNETGLSSVSGLGGSAMDMERDSSIRAAYKLSVRKKRSFHRNSWTPSLSTSSTSAPSAKSAGLPASPIRFGGTEATPSVPAAISIATMRTLFAQRPGYNPSVNTRAVLPLVTPGLPLKAPSESTSPTASRPELPKQHTNGSGQSLSTPLSNRGVTTPTPETSVLIGSKAGS